MKRFENWTLEAIRADGAAFSWMEELRFEWLAATQNAIAQILEGKSIVLVTDDERHWFERYIISSLNKPSLNRPLIPVVGLDSMYPQFRDVNSAEMIDMLDDMLDLSFGGNYFFWYIGRSANSRAEIAKRSGHSYLWIMDEDFQNAMPLRSYDELIDIKLLQLFRLFDKSLSALLFGESDFEQ